MSKCSFNISQVTTRGGVKNEENITPFNVPDKEAVVINSANEFELALILKKKQQNRDMVVSMVKQRIEEKRQILSDSNAEKSICKNRFEDY